jgi:hypothetical protein
LLYPTELRALRTLILLPAPDVIANAPPHPRRNRRPDIGFGKIAAFEHQQARLFRQRREKQVSVIRRRRMAADLAKATNALNATAKSAGPRGELSRIPATGACPTPAPPPAALGGHGSPSSPALTRRRSMAFRPHDRLPKRRPLQDQRVSRIGNAIELTFKHPPPQPSSPAPE